ncbi:MULTISPECIES: hypothetical protein [Eubacteriales]|uniref:hypothetical protein n=1 Tax=Eubacteriales TaxID=186802 RepID=UPI001106A173|nr:MULTISPECIES: hypothetical protein [Eubacteriales]
MKKWLNDVAVLCIFFARPEIFEKSFETVRKARPRILLLWQDGPRPGRPDDVENVRRCREIAENIDWDCIVYKNFHEENMGCDPSTYLSHKWAFSIVDKCIILEDDIVPADSFFSFCKELLDRYENDERIDRICGQTLYGGVPDKRYSYFFGKSGSSWGWASWRRVAQTWEDDYGFLDDEYYIDLARYRFGNQRFEESLAAARKHRKEGIPYWEHIIGFRTTLNSGLVIYPAVNMIKNGGLSANSTHAPQHLAELPKDIQRMFNEPVKEMEFPLKHPPYVIEDYHYFKKVMKIINPNWCVRIRRKIEHQLRKLGLKIGIIK